MINNGPLCRFHNMMTGYICLQQSCDGQTRFECQKCIGEKIHPKCSSSELLPIHTFISNLKTSFKVKEKESLQLKQTQWRQLLEEVQMLGSEVWKQLNKITEIIHTQEIILNFQKSTTIQNLQEILDKLEFESVHYAIHDSKYKYYDLYVIEQQLNEDIEKVLTPIQSLLGKGKLTRTSNLQLNKGTSLVTIQPPINKKLQKLNKLNQSMEQCDDLKAKIGFKKQLEFQLHNDCLDKLTQYGENSFIGISGQELLIFQDVDFKESQQSSFSHKFHTYIHNFIVNAKKQIFTLTTDGQLSKISLKKDSKFKIKLNIIRPFEKEYHIVYVRNPDIEFDQIITIEPSSRKFREFQLYPKTSQQKNDKLRESNRNILLDDGDVIALNHFDSFLFIGQKTGKITKLSARTLMLHTIFQFTKQQINEIYLFQDYVIAVKNKSLILTKYSQFSDQKHYATDDQVMELVSLKIQDTIVIVCIRQNKRPIILIDYSVDDDEMMKTQNITAEGITNTLTIERKGKVFLGFLTSKGSIILYGIPQKYLLTEKKYL